MAGSSLFTFLFTDIEGSTRRWEADAEAMRAALTAHDDVLRSCVAAQDGTVFKHTGDGICAVFDSPTAAIEAAVHAQRVLQLPVRMGVATGEAELRDGDYFGTALNRAARIMAAGHGGQILVDGTSAALLSGVDLVPLGTKRLRDIAKPVELAQVCADGLARDFPPLKTYDVKPGNLRPRTNAFIGRTAELAQLQDAVARHRLLTLTGVGGVGKTRLALEVAARVADDFSDGVWVIELAAVGDPDALPNAVGAALGIAQQPGMSLTESIAVALDGRARLLIFDNCEHLLDAAADMIETITSRSQTVTIMATSREGLRIDGEQLWPVPSLDTSRGSTSAAAELFITRARANAPGVALTPESAVAEICTRLDGIPLAIELAASRLMSMPVSEIRDRLDDRFRLLVGSRRGLERHQTLRHAVQWSFDLLDDDEKCLLTTCSVFSGGFDASGAAAVSELDEYTTLDLLDSLVRRSLLVADRTSRRTRFSMLETIRQFAEEHLVSDGRAAAARQAHARFYAGCEDMLNTLWDSPRDGEVVEWFTTELPNLRSAFRWTVDNEDLDLAATLAAVTAPLGNWNDVHEAVNWATELIEPARAAAHPRLAQLYVSAAQCSILGRVQESIDYAEPGKAALRDPRFEPVPFGLDAYLFNGYIFVGEFTRVVAWCQELLAEQPEHLTARSLLTHMLAMSGATAESVTQAELVMAAVDESNIPHVRCYGLMVCGWAYFFADPAKAATVLTQAAAISRAVGLRQFEAHSALLLSSLIAGGDDPAKACEPMASAIQIHYDAGSLVMMRAVLACAGALLTRLERYDAAARVLGAADLSMAPLAYVDPDAVVDELREVLGAATYETLVAAGAAMPSSAIVRYALEQLAAEIS